MGLVDADLKMKASMGAKLASKALRAPAGVLGSMKVPAFRKKLEDVHGCRFCFPSTSSAATRIESTSTLPLPLFA